MKKLLTSVALALTLLWTPTAFAQTTAPQSAPAETQIQPQIMAKPLMWVLKDEDSTIYFLGSFHLMHENVNWYDARVKSAYESADEVWFELTDLDDQAKAAQLMQRYGIDPDHGVTSGLSDADIARTDAILSRYGYNVAMFKPVRKWMVALVIGVAEIKRLGFSPENGVDRVLMKKATEDHKPIHAFETMEAQFDALVPDSYEVETREFIVMLNDFDKTPEMFEKVSQAWIKGDEKTLIDLVVTEAKIKTPENYQAVFVKRNQNWVPQVETILKGKGTTLVVVGAGHLVGDDSVIAMLKAKGYKIKKL